MFELFKARAEAVSAEVHRFADRSEALAFLVNFLRAEGIGSNGARAVWAPCAFLDGVDREQLHADAPGVSLEVTRDAAASAHIGISQMEWAVAQTGTLLQDASAVEQRLVSALPPIHVAFVATGRILPDMAVALSKFDPRRSRYLAAITGPSRTADIERVLTIGVHGPKRLVIICVDDLDQAVSQ